MPAAESPRSAKRFGAVISVNAVGSQSATSSHSSGIETRASGVGLTDQADATVRSLAFWLWWMKTPWRSAFHQSLGGSAARPPPQPRRPGVRSALLVDDLEADAVRIDHAHVRPVRGAPQCALSDREVVLRDVEVPVPRLREHHLLGVGDRHLDARAFE